MASCNICLEGFKQPVSLPCGHIFCTECVIKTVQAIRPIRTIHSCPMCRASYNIAPLNPLVLPPHLRPFITPTIRRVFLDSPEESKEPPSPIPPNVAEELARLRSENLALKSHCTLWKRRAEVHSAATLGLLDLARTVRDQAASLARERDQWARQCHSLKRKLDDHTHPSPLTFGHCPESPSSSSFTFSFPPPSHAPTAHPPPPPPLAPPPSASDSSGSVEASRLAMAALYDFHSCLSQTRSSHHPRSGDLDPWPRQSANTSASSSSSSPTDVPSSSNIGSVSGISPAQTSLEQPPTKRARRDSVEMGPGQQRQSNRLPVFGSSSSTRRIPS